MADWFKRGRRKQQDPNFPDETPLQSLTYAVLDTEFTSLDSRSNRLLSIGAITMQGTKICLGDQFYRVVNPGVIVPAQGVLIHRLRQRDVEHGEPIPQALDSLAQFISGKVLVGHFVNIDLKLLRKELAEEAGRFTNPALDTAQAHRWLVRNSGYREDLGYQLENVDLATLAKHYRLEFREAHNALEDAYVTARLWQKLLCALEAKGVHTLGEALRIAAA